MNKKLNVLLVDDEELILLDWQHELSSEGYNVRTAICGKDAIKEAKKEKPDIVITDLVMPEMNGVDVCKKIKQLYPDTEVVFVSGYPSETEKQLMSFIHAGGRDEYLRKPLQDDEIRRTVNEIARA